jgi:hypothetical protein
MFYLAGERKLAGLAGVESPFVEGHDHRPVPGALAVFDQGLDFIWGEELRCGLGLRFFPRGLDGFDFLLGAGPNTRSRSSRGETA